MAEPPSFVFGMQYFSGRRHEAQVSRLPFLRWREALLLLWHQFQQLVSSQLVKSYLNPGSIAVAIHRNCAPDLPPNLRKALASDPKALTVWEDLTPLARNEWICWVISVKKPETRREHVERVCPELKEGIRRPCCWMGCIHRIDKPLSPSQGFLLGKQFKKWVK